MTYILRLFDFWNFSSPFLFLLFFSFCCEICLLLKHHADEWHRSFIQTVKCSLLDKKLVIQSFYGAPLTFSYFLLQEKFCFGRSQQDLCDVYCRRPCQKNYISGYIWHKSFIQTVKCSFSNQIIVNQSFCGAAHIKLFFASKVLCFGTCWQVTCQMFIKHPKDLVEKIISPVIFDTNRSFKE